MGFKLRSLAKGEDMCVERLLPVVRRGFMLQPHRELNAIAPHLAVLHADVPAHQLQLLRARGVAVAKLAAVVLVLAVPGDHVPARLDDGVEGERGDGHQAGADDTVRADAQEGARAHLL